MRESQIDRYFAREVKKIGGLDRKIQYVGRRHASDHLVGWISPVIDFVELKRPGKKARPGQAREHARWRARGFNVWVISTKSEVDFYIQFRRTLGLK